MTLHAKALLTRTRAGIITQVVVETYTTHAGHFLSVEAANVRMTPIGPVVTESTLHSHQIQDTTLLKERLEEGLLNAQMLGFTIDFLMDYDATPEGRQSIHVVHNNP